MNQSLIKFKNNNKTASRRISLKFESILLLLLFRNNMSQQSRLR